MKKIRPVFKTHGGKFYLTDFIINNFPSNYTELNYIEGCCGGASVLLNKEPSIFETCNDVDQNIAGIFNELTGENNKSFVDKIIKIKYNKEAFEWSKDTSENGIGTERFLAELVRRRMSRGGLRETFSWSNRLRGGRCGDENAWETYKIQLEYIIKRLSNVKICCMPIVEMIDKFDGCNVLWYVDPPYLPSTRQSKEIYTKEMTEEQHIELAEHLNSAKGKVAISGYQSNLYSKLYKKWDLKCMVIPNHSGQTKNKQKRIECLWTNY